MQKRGDGKDPSDLSFYEGLIFTTAQLVCANRPEKEFDDVCQVLRVKAWQALVAYNLNRRGPRQQTIEKFVFMCLRNKVKDLLNHVRRRDQHLADFIVDHELSVPGAGLQSESRVELRLGLAVDHEQVYGAVEDDGLLIPNTLSDDERQVLALLYLGYRQSEAGKHLGLGKRDMERVMRGLRTKLADWRPGQGPLEPEPATEVVVEEAA